MEEKKIIVDEIAERIRDVLFMNANKHAEEMFNQIPMEAFDNPDTLIHINFQINLMINDLIQIIGRERRKNKNHSWLFRRRNDEVHSTSK